MPGYGTRAARALLLTPDEELRHRTPADIPEILNLDEWHGDADDLDGLRQLVGDGDLTASRRYRPAAPITPTSRAEPLPVETPADVTALVEELARPGADTLRLADH